MAPGAAVVGDVEIGPRASVWFNVTIRGALRCPTPAPWPALTPRRVRVKDPCALPISPP